MACNCAIKNMDVFLEYICDKLCKYRDLVESLSESQEILDCICCECEIKHLFDGLMSVEKENMSRSGE